jgi:hypothetical protein
MILHVFKKDRMQLLSQTQKIIRVVKALVCRQSRPRETIKETFILPTGLNERYGRTLRRRRYHEKAAKHRSNLGAYIKSLNAVFFRQPKCNFPL